MRIVHDHLSDGPISMSCSFHYEAELAAARPRREGQG